MNKIKNILFICFGNTARSPAARYLAQHYAEKYNLDVQFDSAGFINAFTYMQPESQAYLSLKGIDFSDFTPQLITHKLLEKYDLIVTMERSHVLDILRHYPAIKNIKEKTITLKEFNGETNNLDIIDPYYASSEMYQEVLKLIDNGVEKLVKKLIQINNSS